MPEKKPITHTYSGPGPEEPGSFGRDLKTIEKRVGLPDYFQNKAESLASVEDVVVFDAGCGSGEAMNDWYNLMIQMYPSKNTRTVGITEDPNHKAHAILEDKGTNGKASVELWHYTITAGQSVDAFFSLATIPKIDFGWASYSLMYLSARQSFKTIASIFEKLSPGAEFIIINPGNNTSPQPGFRGRSNHEIDANSQPKNLESDIQEITTWPTARLLNYFKDATSKHIDVLLKNWKVEELDSFFDSTLGNLWKRFEGELPAYQVTKDLEKQTIRRDLPSLDFSLYSFTEEEYTTLFAYKKIAEILFSAMKEKQVKRQEIAREQLFKQLEKIPNLTLKIHKDPNNGTPVFFSIIKEA